MSGENMSNIRLLERPQSMWPNALTCIGNQVCFVGIAGSKQALDLMKSIRVSAPKFKDKKSFTHSSSSIKSNDYEGDKVLNFLPVKTEHNPTTTPSMGKVINLLPKK